MALHGGVDIGDAIGDMRLRSKRPGYGRVRLEPDELDVVGMLAGARHPARGSPRPSSPWAAYLGHDPDVVELRAIESAARLPSTGCFRNTGTLSSATHGQGAACACLRRGPPRRSRDPLRRHDRPIRADGHETVMCHATSGDRGASSLGREEISRDPARGGSAGRAVIGAEHRTLGLSDGEVNAADPGPEAGSSSMSSGTRGRT